MLQRTNYKRIIILGAGGSGKTTLAKKLSKITNIETYHLDKAYWLPNWEKPKTEDFTQKITDIASRETWITDGNYIDTLPIRLARADLIIMLDINPQTCVRRIFFRTLKSHFIKRDDLDTFCFEHFNDHYKSFCKWVKDFRKEYYPKLIALCEKYPNIELITLHKQKEINQLLKLISRKDNNEKN